MAKVTPTRAELSRCHSILTRLEWIEREYLDMSDEFRANLNEEFEPENRFLPLLRTLITTTQDIVSIAEERKPKADDAYTPTEDEQRRYFKAVDKITRAGLTLPLETMKSMTDFKQKLAFLERVAEAF